VLVPQVLVEAYSVITDAKRVGRPVDPPRAWEALSALTHGVPVVWPDARATSEFASIVERQAPRAPAAYDAFLVAQMRAGGIDAICTHDARGFGRFADIAVHTPASLLRRS
jgi:predicted nucleic acid-binding protein